MKGAGTHLKPWLAPSNPTHLSLLPLQPFPKTSKPKFFPKDNTQVLLPQWTVGGKSQPEPQQGGSVG